MKRKTCLALAAAMVTTSCATGPNGSPQGFEKTVKDTFASEDPCSNNARNIGMLGGAVLGVVLAKAVGKGPALVAGAGIGALLGGLIGADMDRRRCELTKVAKAHNLDIVMTDIAFSPAAVEPPSPDGQVTSASRATTPVGSSLAAVATKKPEPVGMSLTIADHGQQFAVGMSVPSADAVKAFGAVADQYRAHAVTTDPASVQAVQVRNKQMRILLVGHTDDTGASAQNAELSEDRAQAIAKIFSQHGFSAEQLFYQGAGEVFPVATNATEEGRSRNRRVEIVDLSDDAAFTTYLASRRPNVAHYRSAPDIKARTEVLSGIVPAAGKAPKTNKLVDSTTAKVAKAASVASAPSATVDAKAPALLAAPSTATIGEVSVLATAPQARVSAPKPGAAPASTLSNIDLGGTPADGQFRNADIGKPTRSTLWSIVSSAYASDESPVRSCATDRPRISRGVKSLGTGQVIKTSEYLPGTANASWAGKANGHLVGLTGVSVLRDGGQPANLPNFLIWKNFVEGSGARSDFKATANVNAYQGDKALLYRVFLSEGPVRCIDLVIPKGSANTAPTSNIIYDHDRALYQADFSPTIVR